MHHYNIGKLKVYDPRFRAKCIVCNRPPRKGRYLYSITSYTDEPDRGAYRFHHGSTDTVRCAMNFIMAHMGD